MEHYDVIIIGTGAGGGTLAHKLAPSGKKILLLERGGYLPREPENWDSREIFRKERYLSDELWLRQGRQSLQATPAVLRGRQHEVLRGDPVPPARTRLRRGRALRRRLAGVADLLLGSGALLHGGGEAVPRPRAAGEDPTEPTGPGPFPYPAVSHEPRIQQLSDDFERTGHHPFHLPVGIDLNESDPEAGRCVRCDRFDGFPCLTDGKADAHVRCVRPALKHGNVKLIMHAKVERLETDASGHTVTRVHVESPRHARRGLQRRYRGRLLRGHKLGRAAAEVRQR